MIKDMFEVMQRIHDIRERFGVNRTRNISGKRSSDSSYQRIHDKSLSDAYLTKGTQMNDLKKQSLTENDINMLAERYAERNNVPSSLVKAIIKHESGYNPRAVSPKGAMGLMQLMPAVAQSMGVTDPFSPEENINAGTSLLKKLLDEYNGDYKRALSAYNAGPRAVETYRGVPDYPETKEYVKKVIESYMKNR